MSNEKVDAKNKGCDGLIIDTYRLDGDFFKMVLTIFLVHRTILLLDFIS